MCGIFGVATFCAVYVRECLVCGLIGMVTFCIIFVGNVWCMNCLVWLRSGQFV